MADDIPQWAKERACELAMQGAQTTVLCLCLPSDRSVYLDAFARYIAAHEQPPVDPLQECLRETYGAAAPEFVSAFRAALEKRGLKVVDASERQP